MCDEDIKNMMEIDTDDNLNLEDIPLVDIPGDILFPEELNQYLRGRIQYLIQTNAKLEQQLMAKDEEIQKYNVKTLNLTNKISEYEVITQDLKGVAPTPTASKLMSQKIVEISKKLREKNCEFEVFKTQYNKLLQKVTDLENKNKDDRDEVKKPDNTDVKIVDSSIEQAKLLQEKLSIANNKLFESKNQNTQLKNDLKMANKILLQELGDNFISIQNFITNGNANGWRGRAQQIINLQQKNSELQERISSMSDKETIIVPKPDNRKQIIEQLNKDLSSVKKELEDNIKKLNSSRARVKVLETECQSMRTKNATQNEKLISNEQLIKMLTNQVTNLEEQQNYISKESQINSEFITKTFQTELAKERCKLENLTKKLEQKENKITELKNELNRVLDPSGNNTPSILSPVLENQEKLNGKMNVLDVEVNRLLELVAVLNSRLDTERKEHTETQGLFRKERQRAAKLETKLLRLEMEMNVFKSQFYSKSGTKMSSQTSVTDNLSVESVKNNLEIAEENIKALETKIVILQREKEMDYQRFCEIINNTRNIMKKYDMIL